MLKKSKVSRKVKKSKRSAKVKRNLSWNKPILSRKLVLLVALAIIAGTAAYLQRPEDLGLKLPPPPADALYKQSGQPIESRVQDLLGRMTLEEKIGQMALVDKNSLKKIEDVSRYYLGGMLSGAGAKPDINTPQGWLDMVSEIKSQADNSRLRIPILYGIDANHGHSNVLGATIFPHAIGLGASRDADLVTAVAKATAAELTATGVNWNFSPSLDAPKDIRWGRVYEAFSDDPMLNGTLGAAFIEGMQAAMSGNPSIMAAAKHYLATGAMEWNQSNNKKFKIDQGRTSADEQALVSEYLPPYKAAVEVGVSSVMIGLNQWGEQRVIDSKYLLTDKLKTELGFKGFVVSDWYGVYEYAETSKYQANINTINAGLDMAMLPYDYKDFLIDVRKAVKSGKISRSRIDDAVSRILYQKFKAGLFDIDTENAGLENVGSVTHRQLARQAVASSVVLLKNENTLLPLSKNSGHILIAGSGADNVGRQSGAWTVEWQGVDGNWMPGGTSILQGIRQLAGNNRIEYDISGIFDGLTSKADVGIAIISERPYAEGWGDNANPTIEKADLEVIQRLKLSSNKVVVVILSGRPLLITDQITGWDAAVAAWLPGSEGGGVADVLFGNSKFSGKLPLPWPSVIQQLPINTNGITNNRTRPLFERGFGL
ncbi:glycoside hydrolase family 3 C-terminal domain-containing protein [Candidatus Saccharibacteria bacterium]|nr:glycoside hydrolase family 3 C-terminal domain-containing protein [Candidatus Saccharibacteria bacterium]